MGYHRAGFDVIGVDIKPQPHYPFEFHRGDAGLISHHWIYDQGVSAIHASPPCQRWALASNGRDRSQYPDLIPITRGILEFARVPWVIENVPRAPIRADYLICGCQVGLALRRTRAFEASWHGGGELLPPCAHYGPVVSVVGHGTPTWVRQKLGRNPTIADYRAAMGIDWMNRDELSQAIPPPYTEFIGRQLLASLPMVA